ncbi:MAG: GTPase HflX [Fusobacteriaceae bacterium]|jgi:GTP-binding protein HflX|nr:GTPase HflX [Fusobacteriaceae bacterium]
MIKGNTGGIRETVLSALESIHTIKLEKDVFISEEILVPMAEISARINREISVSIDRKGNVAEISIGDDRTAGLPAVTAAEGKLSGIRVFHTHPGGDSRLSDVDISALVKLRLDAMCAIGVAGDGRITDISAGFCALGEEGVSYRLTRPFSPDQATRVDYLRIIGEIEAAGVRESGVATESDKERAVLVGLENEALLKELAELAEACGIEAVGTFLQKKAKPDNVTFLGSGKVRELSLFRQVRKADLVIFDDELSGIQAKNLEEILGCRVMDRTVLILEIFAKRAVSREGKIQVELARLKYSAAKLTGQGAGMSRAGFGIRGGSGETKLETDRRRIRDRILVLKKELAELERARAVRRERRELSGIPRIALVGYTNAGKSTLRNLLVREYPVRAGAKNEAVFAEDMLFATLDVTTRSIQLPSRKVLSFTDTVGFIRKLPHDLVEAFKSTLDEVLYADVIVHVADGASEDIPAEIRAVESVLGELGAADKPTLLALNKKDRLTPEKTTEITELFPGYRSVLLSAKFNEGIPAFLEAVEALIPEKTWIERYRIPYSDTASVAWLHRNALVEEERYEAECVLLRCVVGPGVSGKMEKYRV